MYLTKPSKVLFAKIATIEQLKKHAAFIKETRVLCEMGIFGDEREFGITGMSLSAGTRKIKREVKCNIILLSAEIVTSFAKVTVIFTALPPLMTLCVRWDLDSFGGSITPLEEIAFIFKFWKALLFEIFLFNNPPTCSYYETHVAKVKF
uniref:Uncharacterized protein n=1 Tax=Glossina brevipalpis TaxID=37001 RepID=A0A1A9WTV1_9MUSC